jgi:hypothetical protein
MTMPSIVPVKTDAESMNGSAVIAAPASTCQLSVPDVASIPRNIPSCPAMTTEPAVTAGDVDVAPPAANLHRSVPELASRATIAPSRLDA